MRQYDPEKRRGIQKNKIESGHSGVNEANFYTKENEFSQSNDNTTETIASISTENANNTPNSGSSNDISSSGNACNDMDDDEEAESLELFGHEKRALNYLVNEYLLQQGYRLTAITFSDENTDEDFEDWDSIGLNISKPPDLARIYRECYSSTSSSRGTRNAIPKSTSDHEVQCEMSSDTESQLMEILSNKEHAMEELKQKLQEEIDKTDNLCELSVQKEIFEEMEKDLKSQIFQLEEQRDSLLVGQNSKIVTNTESETDMEGDVVDEKDINMLSSENTDDINCSTKEITQDYINFSSPFLTFIERLCIPCSDNSRSLEQSNSSYTETFEDIISLLAEQLPEIIPHVLLARRGTVLPLLLIAVEHHTSPDVRDNLLTILFNLTKKPDEEMRLVIVKGFLEIVSRQNARNNTTMVEAEILPQLWQQIEHKHSERRILVAETCASLIPYIPTDIRDSLVFSMLQQLVLQDRENQVIQSSPQQSQHQLL